MNTYLLARHGQTINNRERRLSGWIDTPLTEQGLVPTLVAAQKIKGTHIDHIISSDSGRAFVTAYVIARELDFKKEIIRMPGLREVNYGDAANMKSIDAYSQYPLLDRDTHYVPPNGESLDQMQSRVLNTVFELDDIYNDETLLLVAHSGVMAAINSSFTGEDFGKHNISEAYPHEYVAKFTVNEHKISSFEELT
jgi:broad specificity phosphatase PhoE